MSLPSKHATQLEQAKLTFNQIKTLKSTKSHISKRPATPTHKGKASDTIARPSKTPVHARKVRSKSKSTVRLTASKSKLKNQLITGSKYFANIFGEVTAVNYFNEKNKDASMGDTPAEITSSIMQVQALHDKSNPINDGNSTIHKVQSEKQIKKPADDETVFDLLKENNYMLMNQTPTKNLFKSEVHTLPKDQMFDLLLKTSEIAQKHQNLRNSFANLVSSLPLQSIKVQNIKSLYHITVNKNTTHSGETFHNKCDNKGPYLGFVKHNAGIFGFFVEGDFNDEFEVYHRSSLNLIFTIVSPYSDRFTSFKVKKDKEAYALCNTEDGFCLGMPTANNRDLYMNFDDLRKCSSKLGFAYETGDWQADHLAGKYTDWNISEIEILQIVNHIPSIVRKRP